MRAALVIALLGGLGAAASVVAEESAIERAARKTGAFLERTGEKVKPGLDRAGKAVISEDGVNDWISGVGGAPPQMVIDERLGPPVVQVDGNLASVWVYYELYVSDRFSHCGADQFTLGRTPDGWKIIGVADSRRRGAGCAQNLPKGS